MSFMCFLSGQWDLELQGQFKILTAEGHRLGEKGFLLSGGVEAWKGLKIVLWIGAPGPGLYPTPGSGVPFS